MYKRSIFFGLIFWPVTIVFGLALIIAYSSRYVNPAIFWIPSFFGLYFMPLVLINLFFFLLSALRRSAAAWVPFICLLPALLFTDLFVRWGTPEETPPGMSVKIATYNVCNFWGYGKNSRERTMEAMEQLFRKEQVEIACLQEFLVPVVDKNSVFSMFPYRHYCNKKATKHYQGNVILSRFPIESSGELDFLDSPRSCIYADINIRGRLVRVYTTHLESNKVSLTALADRKYKEKEASQELLQAHLRIRDAFLVRATQVKTIEEHLGKIPASTPFILCGDFNDTPISYTYHHLSKGLGDSFQSAGKGFAATFRNLWPGLRIDYILYNDAFSAKNHRTLRVPFSDHYPVISELILP